MMVVVMPGWCGRAAGLLRGIEQGCKTGIAA